MVFRRRGDGEHFGERHVNGSAWDDDSTERAVLGIRIPDDTLPLPSLRIRGSLSAPRMPLFDARTVMSHTGWVCFLGAEPSSLPRDLVGRRRDDGWRSGRACGRRHCGAAVCAAVRHDADGRWASQ